MQIPQLEGLTKQQRLLDHFREQIASGVFKPGDRLPTEVVLAAQFGVNRNTIGKALAVLATERVILRRKGGGTVVLRTPPPQPERATGSAADTVGGGTIVISYAVRTDDPNYLVNPPTRILTALETALAAQAPCLRATCINSFPGWTLDAARVGAAGGLRGIVHMTATADPAPSMANLDTLRAFPVPHVVIGSETDLPGCDLIATSQVEFGRLAARHLLGLGHRRLLYLAPDLDDGWIAQRIDGFRQALVDAGLAFTPDLVLRIGTQIGPMPESPALGQQAARIIAERGGITGVVAVNDVYAASLVLALRERGIAVPERISVIGTDDAFSLRDLNLSTIRPPADRIGDAAIRMLLARIHAPAPRHHSETWHMHPTLVERSTTAAVAAAVEL